MHVLLDMFQTYFPYAQNSPVPEKCFEITVNSLVAYTQTAENQIAFKIAANIENRHCVCMALMNGGVVNV